MTTQILRAEEEAVRASYAQVPYPSTCQPTAHPDNLATRAFLWGLDPAPPGRCRLLELGCADGGHLIPLACALPGSRFVGVDLEPGQVARGRQRLAELELGNVELHARSILDLDGRLGTFDYVVAHGVFSWVGREVQEKILALCAQSLAPHGVAYVSYNTYPGWHARGMGREMMLYHARGEADPRRRLERGTELLGFLAGSAGGNDAHALALRALAGHVAGARPGYLIHEYLEETNSPLYFHEFAGRAARHGLQYLDDADHDLPALEAFPPAVAERLRGWAGDRIELEQYLDFLTNRTFRRTLLCHEGLVLDRTLDLDRLRRLHAASSARAVAGDDPASERATFRAAGGRTFSTSHPIARDALLRLGETWPRALPFAVLAGEVRERLGAEWETAGGEPVLADVLHSLHWTGIVDLHLAPPQCVEAVSERPRATPLARREALAGPLVTSQRHESVRIDDDVARFLLAHLDGNRDRAALAGLLEREVAAGRLEVQHDGEPVRAPAARRPVLERLVDENLRRMAGLALLVG